jgi:hypothetical protein
LRTWIERVPSRGQQITRAIDRWKAMRREGWDLHCLQELASGDLICFGFLLEPVQLRLSQPVGDFLLG